MRRAPTILTRYLYFIHRGDGVPVYVGLTTQPKIRLKDHRSSWRFRGGRADMHILNATDDESLMLRWERWTLAMLRAAGFELANASNGGDPGRPIVRSYFDAPRTRTSAA